MLDVYCYCIYIIVYIHGIFSGPMDNVFMSVPVEGSPKSSEDFLLD